MNDKITVTDYFGGCPKCGGSDGLYNVGRANWFVCHTHKVRWTVGSNILSSWRYETEDEQREVGGGRRLRRHRGRLSAGGRLVARPRRSQQGAGRAPLQRVG